jgi:hypothetical protein
MSLRHKFVCAATSLAFGLAALSPVFCNAQSVARLAAYNLSADDQSSPAPSADQAQSDSQAAHPSETHDKGARSAASEGATPIGRVGVAFHVSLLGIGGDVATPVTRRSNVRFGFNALGYSRGFNNDGIAYAAQLSFKSFETHYDYFPFGGSFHISPGLMIYNGNNATAAASVPGLNTFTLGSNTYTSDPANPVTGSGKIDFRHVAPEIAVGWGNLLPRNGRRWSIPFEMGVVFQGSPNAKLALNGTACDQSGVCRNAATDPVVLSDIQAQQTKLNNDMSFFKYYPIISIGFGYKF